MTVGECAGFELTEHTADVGVHAWGATAADVFEQAALGMVSLMYPVAEVRAREREEISLDSPGGELLLASWLNELLFVIESRQVVFARFDVIQAGQALGAAPTTDAAAGAPGAPWVLRAAGLGEAIDARRHHVRLGVKAATLHDLQLTRCDTGWEGRVLLDV